MKTRRKKSPAAAANDASSSLPVQKSAAPVRKSDPPRLDISTYLVPFRRVIE